MKKSKFKFKKTYFAFPYTVISVVFVIVPLLILIYYAFTDDYGSFTLENFESFGTSDLRTTIYRSLLMALCTTVGCLAFAYPLAMALAKIKSNKTFIIVMMFVLPMWINSLLRIYAVKLLFNDYLHMEQNFLLVLIGNIYDYFPFMLLPIYTILSNMEKSYFEASNDLGANSFKTFLKVKLPLSIPGIISGVLMVFMPTVSSFATYDILGGSSGSYFGNIIYMWFEGGFYGIGSALAFVMLLLILLSVAISSSLNKLTTPSNKQKGGINV